MSLPLEGIRVVDWTIFQQGPVASMLLADLGAEVIKVEAPGGGDNTRGMHRILGLDLSLSDGRSAYFEVLNRNKKSVAVDAHHPHGRAILYRLIERADVFVQNFRVGVAERLGVDYETLRALNPRLVYGSASSFGPLGPDRERPAYDHTASARSGFHAAMYDLQAEEPHYLPVSCGDQGGAALLAFGVLAALLARERSGFGQKVETSLLSTLMFLEAQLINFYLLAGKMLPRVGHTESTNPLANSYRCRDGKWLCVSLLQYDRLWHDFCAAVARPDLEHDPRFACAEHATANHQALIAELDKVFAQRTAAEWVEIFSAYPAFVYQTVNTVAELVDDPQVKANHFILEYEHPTLGTLRTLAPPVSFSGGPAGVRLPAPVLGEHTEEVLTEVCGYTWEEVVAFREAGAI